MKSRQIVRDSLYTKRNTWAKEAFMCLAFFGFVLIMVLL